MLKICPKQTQKEIQSFLGGELYYNAKLSQAEQDDFVDLLTRYYFPKLAEVKDKDEKDIVQEALQNNFFAKFKDYKSLNAYNESEFSAGHKQNTQEKKTQGGVDFVLKKDGQVAVIFEAKKTDNFEMINVNDCNKTALHEAILYYLREKELARLNNAKFAVKFIIITDFYQFFIFKESEFDRLFYQNAYIKGLYSNYKSLSSSSLAKEKDDKMRNKKFYNELKEYFKDYKQPIKESLFDDENPTLRPLHLDLNIILNDDTHSKDIKRFFKAFMPDFLLSKFTAPKSEINNDFYNELLYILGLKENDDKAKKKDKSTIKTAKYAIVSNGVSGTLYENIKESIQEENDKTPENIISLIIVWLNRILFLKLIEANLVRFNAPLSARGGGLDKSSIRFLNSVTIKDFQMLDKLFFEVFAKAHSQRDKQSPFYHLPYLNSSLFMPSEAEKRLIHIKSLSNDKKLQPFSSYKGKSKATTDTSKDLLSYLLDFLDSYDFNSGEEFESHTLINANILGNVFERINAYKDGSFYTPSAITTYMCKQSIEKVVIDKFNTQFEWQCENLSALRKRIDREFDTKEREFKDTLQNIRICDPAVGSGHFLVAALNQMIKIYYDLGLCGEIQRIKDLYIIGDELIFEDFSYTKPQNNEKDKFHEIQKALFHLKKDIIENNLFGVDINPNSVEICKLRLWIELLKNSYYLQKGDEEFDTNLDKIGVHQMQTLPNIDINIKCGNSLLSRFALKDSFNDKDIKKQVENYKALVFDYKNADKAKHKISKSEMQKRINLIKQSFAVSLTDFKTKSALEKALETHLGYYGNFLLDDEKLFDGIALQSNLNFEMKLDENTQEKAVKSFANIKLLRTKLDNALSSERYKDTFEWRFEFPEILNEQGEFIGFDLVVGNPPYIRQEEIKELKPHLAKAYEIYTGTSDIYTYFYEQGFKVLNEKGILSFITSNKFARAGYGEKLREFLLTRTTLLEFVDLNGLKVFENAVVDTCVLNLSKQKPAKSHTLNYANPQGKDLSNLTYTAIPQNALTKEAFIFGDNALFELKRKIEKIGTPLKEWDIKIYRGVLTGYNEAFIIDTAKKDEILAGCDDSDKSRKSFPVIASKAKPCAAIHTLTEKERTAQIIKPILRGRDIKRYSYEWAGLWIIGTFPVLNLDINDYPTLKKYLENFMPRIAQSGEKGCRKKTSNKWFETQDNIAYYEDFEKEKIVYSEIVQEPQFYLDNDNFYAEATSFILTGENLKYLIALLNSKFVAYVFKAFYAGGGLGESGYRYKKAFIEKLPIPKINSSNKNLADEIINLVDKILEFKKQNKDTNEFEKQIDDLVYKLYDLNDDEIKIINTNS